MNFEFSDPIRVNELFRPILQELLLEDNINLEKLKIKLIVNIKIIFKKYDSSEHNNLNLTDQILNKMEESLNILFLNDLIKKENDLYSLSDKAKYHIQSLDPIKISGFSGNLEFILDFLP